MSGQSVEDLFASAAPKPKPAAMKSSSGGTPVSELFKSQDKPAPPKPSDTTASRFLARSATAVKAAAAAAVEDPTKAAPGAITALVKGAVSMADLAATGVAAIAKSMITPQPVDPKLSPQQQAEKSLDYSVSTFVANQEKLSAAIKTIDSAPASKQEEAMNGLLQIIPDGINAVGDSVYEKTGSALAATGALSLATLLTLSPEIASKTLGKLSESAAREKPVGAKVGSAFDSLAAQHPEAASALANHVNLVDPATSKYLHKRVQKYIDASDKDLSELGRRAAEAAIKEMTPPSMDEIIKGGTTNLKGGKAGEVYKGPDPGKRLGEPIPPPVRRGPLGEPLDTPAASMTPERVSASIRAAIKEGYEAQNMALSKEGRALERERVASARATAEGHPREPEIEPIPKRAAVHEGEVARRKAEDLHPDSENLNVVARSFADDGKVVSAQDPKIVYFNSGIPVTRDAVINAFKFVDAAASKIPGVEIAKAKVGRLYEGYISTFNPEAKGPAARTAGAAIARNFFEQSHREHVVWEQGKERRTFWMKAGDEASLNFIHEFETGKRLSNPLMEQARQAYVKWAADIFRQDMRTGFTYDPVDHYMPHLFKDGDGVIRFLQKRYGNKWADPRFTKERGFDLYREAMEAGFTPRFTSPEEIMQARQIASDIAALRTDLLADFERKGIAIKAAKGAERPPPGYSPNSRRSPTGIRYWVSEDLDPLMHNAFDSKGLWADSGLKGDAFRGFMEVKNKIVPIKLGASLFHPMHVLHIDASAELSRATKLMVGSPSLAHAKDFMLSAATAYLKPLWTNPKMGYPLLKVFQGQRDFESLSDYEKAAYKDLAESGMIPSRPQEETSGAIQKFHDAVDKQSASVLWHAPWAGLAALSHPLFGVWIPSLKIASVLKDMKVGRELNPNWTDMQRQEAFRQMGRKVEARYGEMNYNSLFMDKMLKDVGVASTLSLGWQVGLLDQYVGGAIDLTKAVGKKGALAAGDLDRPIFASYYIGTALMIGGVMHYMFTGKQPSSLIDYTHPESGEKDQYGKPVRLNTMFYTREFEGLAKHMQQEGALSGLSEFVTNKGSGMFEMGKAAITGIDSLGNEIYNPHDPAYKQVEQGLLSIYGDLEPISVEAIQRSTGSKAKSAALATLGFTPAGKYISETVMEGQIANSFNKFVRPKEKPFQAVQMAKDVKTLREMFNKDDPKYDSKMEEMIKTYDLDGKDVHKMEKMFGSPKEQEFDPSVYMFSKLPWEEQKPILDRMKAEEREEYLKHISKQKRAKYLRETEE